MKQVKEWRPFTGYVGYYLYSEDTENKTRDLADELSRTLSLRNPLDIMGLTYSDDPQEKQAHIQEFWAKLTRDVDTSKGTEPFKSSWDYVTKGAPLSGISTGQATTFSEQFEAFARTTEGNARFDDVRLKRLTQKQYQENLELTKKLTNGIGSASRLSRQLERLNANSRRGYQAIH